MQSWLQETAKHASMRAGSRAQNYLSRLHHKLLSHQNQTHTKAGANYTGSGHPMGTGQAVSGTRLRPAPHVWFLCKNGRRLGAEPLHFLPPYDKSTESKLPRRRRGQACRFRRDRRAPALERVWNTRFKAGIAAPSQRQTAIRGRFS